MADVLIGICRCTRHMPTKDQWVGIAIILLIWGFAGALFGALFAGLHQVLVASGLSGWPTLMVATALAAMTTSAFYSAMPVALVGTMAGVLASIAYLIASGQDAALPMMAGLAASGGVLAGSGYAWMVKNGSRPLAETLIGLIAGLLAGGCLVLTCLLLGQQVGACTRVSLLVLLFGILFDVLDRWWLNGIARWLPSALSAPVVAGLIATVVGASIWFVGGATTALLDNPGHGQVLGDIPLGLVGGLLGGAMTGLLLAGVRLGARATTKPQ